MKNFRFSNWVRGTTLFPKKFFYDFSLEDDHMRYARRVNIVCFYIREIPTIGEAWTFGKHYIGINYYFCYIIKFVIYR